MKTLSDYTTILRDIAKNLNLHGESVEMIVQMLANSLYISEVEHIAYSQEASLERSTLANSKIQHCVDVMYSVFRGACPRVILNFTASKLFTFNPYDEIIKSNNFKVYYLGYYDEDEGEVIFSGHSIYPESSACIMGLMASDLYESSWSVSDNVYYESHPDSNLSSDLYMKDMSNGEVMVDLTRTFSEHLKDNKFFDLTLPGYGCRIYYPDYYLGTARDNLVNTNFSLTVYKYLQLSSIVESELKSLKLSGATLNPFPESVLMSLNAEESYPGLIYISETERDGIDTIHHKANKNRFAGTYISTNSDLTYILQETYPGKIRANGVACIFNAPPSTELVPVTGVKDDFKTFGTIQASDFDGLLGEEEVKFLPVGELSFTYYRGGEDTNYSYDLILSSSIIPINISGENLTPRISEISIKILKQQNGETELLTSLEDDMTIEVQYSGSSVTETFYGMSIPIDSIYYCDHLNVYLKKGDVIVDHEKLPVIYYPIATSTETSDGNILIENEVGIYYGLNLLDDTLYIQTDYEGKIISSPNRTQAVMYVNGQVADGVKYSIIPVSDITAEINETTGEIEILGMSDKEKSSLVVMAEYNGNRMSEVLTVVKTIANLPESSRPKSFDIFSSLSEVYPITTLIGSSQKKDYTLIIPENTYEYLKVVADGVNFENVTYSYKYNEIKNLLKPDEENEVVPSLDMYYIPYSESNLLTKSEIDRFIENNKSYYVTHTIRINKGTLCKARFDINLELYNNSILDDSVFEILNRYTYKFGQDFGTLESPTPLYNEIKSLITKLPEVKFVNDIKISYFNSLGDSLDNYYESYIKPNLDITYFDIECNIYSVVSLTNQ